MNQMIALVTFALVGLIAVYMLAASRHDLAELTDEADPADYSSRGRLMTPAEQNAFQSLERALRGKAHVCPKVRVADILQPQPGLSSSERRSALKRIASSHVDFVVIGLHGQILFAVELDDSSDPQPSSQSASQTRDTFLNRAFARAGIALIRVEPGRLGESAALRKAVLAVTGQYGGDGPSHAAKAA